MKMAFVLIIGGFLLATFFSCAEKIPGPKNMPPRGFFILTGTSELPCGILSMEETVVKNSAWSLFFLSKSSNPLLVRYEYMDGESFTIDYWLDKDMDGSFDEFFRDIYPVNTFFEKYPSPCDAVKN